MEQHINVFNSLKNSKTMVGKLVSTKLSKTPEVGDIVDYLYNGTSRKIIFIENEERLETLQDKEDINVLKLEVVNKSSILIVGHELISNSFKKAVADNKVKINTLVVVVTKNDTITNEIMEGIVSPDLLINNDGYAVIKHYLPKSYRKDSKVMDVKFDEKEWYAVKRFQTGERWAISDIDDSIVAGYGSLDEIGSFEFPLPQVYIKQIYGTLSWSEHRKRNNVVFTER